MKFFSRKLSIRVDPIWQNFYLAIFGHMANFFYTHAMVEFEHHKWSSHLVYIKRPHNGLINIVINMYVFILVTEPLYFFEYFRRECRFSEWGDVTLTRRL